MDQSEDYTDYGPRPRLPTPAQLTGCVLIVLVASLIVAGFLTAVVLLDRTSLSP